MGGITFDGAETNAYSANDRIGSGGAHVHAGLRYQGQGQGNAAHPHVALGNRGNAGVAQGQALTAIEREHFEGAVARVPAYASMRESYAHDRYSYSHSHSAVGGPGPTATVAPGIKAERTAYG